MPGIDDDTTFLENVGVTLEDLVVPDITDDELEAAMHGKPIPTGRKRLVVGTVTLQHCKDEDKRGANRPYLLVPLSLEDDSEGHDSILIQAFWPDQTQPDWRNGPWLYKDGNGLCIALGSKFHGRVAEWADEAPGMVVEVDIRQKYDKFRQEQVALIAKYH